jgi:hypothetical protein
VIFVNGIYAFAVVTLVMVMAGAVGGALAVVSLRIRREERDLSLTGDVTDRVARGARRVNRVYVYTRGPAHEPGYYYRRDT